MSYTETPTLVAPLLDSVSPAPQAVRFGARCEVTLAHGSADDGQQARREKESEGRKHATEP